MTTKRRWVETTVGALLGFEDVNNAFDDWEHGDPVVILPAERAREMLRLLRARPLSTRDRLEWVRDRESLLATIDDCQPGGEG